MNNPSHEKIQESKIIQKGPLESQDGGTKKRERQKEGRDEEESKRNRYPSPLATSSRKA